MSAPADAAPARHVAIQIGAQTLLVAQRDLRSIEPALDVVAEPPVPGSVGHIAAGDLDWPVFSLDGDLAPLPHVPAGRRLCLLLGTSAVAFGLLADELQPLDALELRALPACLRTASSPVSALGVWNGRLASVLSVDALAARLDPDRAPTAPDSPELPAATAAPA